jgi:glutamyl-tRNA reductase
VSARTDEVPLVEAIIDEEVAFFDSWCRGAELRPVLTALREKSEEIRAKEMARHLGKIGDADPALREALDAFSRDLVTKLLHEPSRRLRAQSDPVRSRAAAEMLQELFGLAP